PQNDPFETEFLHENWAGTLRRIFATYTPLVIGYGGNDGSLMNFLYSLKRNTIPGIMFWFYRGEKPNKRICRLVARQSGKLVRIVDFNVFMTQLAQLFEFGLIDGEIVQRAEKRARDLRDEWGKVKKKIDAPGTGPYEEEVREASKQLRETLDKVETQRARKMDDWWAWELWAQREPDPAKREAIYHEALKARPSSAELHGAFAVFMARVRKDYDEAEHLFRRAMELDPTNAPYAGNLAYLMWNNRKDYNQAERLYRRALELDPENAKTMGDFAIFMCDVRKDYDEAECLYLRALGLDPEGATNMGNFAGFLLARQRCAEARTISDRAWALGKSEPSQDLAELASYRGLLLLKATESDAPALGRLKTLLQTGFVRGTWTFDDVLSTADEWVSDDDRVLYRALADAILDETKVAALDEFPRWKEVEPIPLHEPWDNLGD
ncbi:MAG: tetratricopeptide repeat protein, partial [Planctomycetota bacterium]